jgi:hypothetical protein
MIYLRHTFGASGLAAPTTIAIVVDDVEWLVAQVRSEMQALFPDAQVHVNPGPAGPGGHEQGPAGPGGHEQRPAGPGGHEQRPAGPGGHEQCPAGPGGHEQRPAGPGGHEQGPAGPGGHEQGTYDLLMVVYSAGRRPEEQLERLGRRARQARTGVALYCVDDRRLDLVRRGDLDRWKKEQRRRRVALSWSRHIPLAWNRVVRRLVAP